MRVVLIHKHVLILVLIISLLLSQSQSSYSKNQNQERSFLITSTSEDNLEDLLKSSSNAFMFIYNQDDKSSKANTKHIKNIKEILYQISELLSISSLEIEYIPIYILSYQDHSFLKFLIGELSDDEDRQFELIFFSNRKFNKYDNSSSSFDFDEISEWFISKFNTIDQESLLTSIKSQAEKETFSDEKERKKFSFQILKGGIKKLSSYLKEIDKDIELYKSDLETFRNKLNYKKMSQNNIDFLIFLVVFLMILVGFIVFLIKIRRRRDKKKINVV